MVNKVDDDLSAKYGAKDSEQKKSIDEISNQQKPIMVTASMGTDTLDDLEENMWSEKDAVDQLAEQRQAIYKQHVSIMEEEGVLSMDDATVVNDLLSKEVPVCMAAFMAHTETQDTEDLLDTLRHILAFIQGHPLTQAPTSLSQIAPNVRRPRAQGGSFTRVLDLAIKKFEG